MCFPEKHSASLSEAFTGSESLHILPYVLTREDNSKITLSAHLISPNSISTLPCCPFPYTMIPIITTAGKYFYIVFH